jgi:hypothetical protein
LPQDRSKPKAKQLTGFYLCMGWTLASILRAVSLFTANNVMMAETKTELAIKI